MAAPLRGRSRGADTPRAQGPKSVFKQGFVFVSFEAGFTALDSWLLVSSIFRKPWSRVVFYPEQLRKNPIVLIPVSIILLGKI